MIETIHPGASAPDPRIAIFDFDGTVSLIRSGWLDIMMSMMVETLSALHTGESEDDLRKLIKAFVWANTGRDTLYQMISLADAVAERGGVPPDPQEYKQQFLVKLFALSGRRIEDLRAGRAAPDQYLVPGTRAMIEDLRARGLSLYLASGTDEVHLKQEADLLDVTRYFDGGVYGALPDPEAFSKRLLVERLLKLPGMRPDRLLGFGDGPVEIEELKRGRALAIGLATDEPECRVPNEWKRHNLIAAGADYIIPNYLCRQALLPTLFANHEPI
ncbi:MAG TPA: HAD family hydrolase [Candidatus Solibacter sp.]|jgi:phosphoglycolate phosphatase-like HAD superfamily hydrolase